MVRMKHLVRVACVGLTAVLLFLIACGASAAGVDGQENAFGSRIPPEGGTVLAAGDASLAGAAGSAAPPSVSAKGAVLMEVESGTVIFGKNENAQMPMASTTKIMTALVALERMPPDALVTVTEASVGVEGSSIYLTVGETLSMEDLLYALLLESANDAAETIAVAVAGNVPAFAALMNEKASELGLTDTHFINPHGLDAEGHYTTAKELACLTRAALENEHFRRICSTRRRIIPLRGKEGVRLLLNHNKLLASYDGCIGVKTGFTKKTGRCLVSAAERDGVSLIAVTLGAPDDWRDHTAMLDYGFSLYRSVTLCEPGFYNAPLPLVAGSCEYVMVENTETLSVVLPRRHGRIECVVERRRFDFAPIAVGQSVGRLCFYEVTGTGRRLLGEVPLRACYTVERVVYKRSLWERVRNGTRIFKNENN